MRLSLRFILPLIFVLALVAYAVVPLVDDLIFNKWATRDLSVRTKLIASTLEDTLIQILRKPSKERARHLFDRVVQDERLYAIAICDQSGKIFYQTGNFPREIGCERSNNFHSPQHFTFPLERGPVHVAYHAIENSGIHLGKLILIHDMSFLQKRSNDTRTYLVYFFTVLGIVVAMITVIVAQLSWMGWIRGLRSLLKGEVLFQPMTNLGSSELRPIVKDLRMLVRDLESERIARDDSKISWTSKTLKEILGKELRGDEVLIVSNREPYIHVRRKNKIEIQVPASGLVTALEPVMRACSGTWIAHGGGSADKEVVDKNDRVKVPPENPSYTIRRVWLSKEEEEGYYYGFANEGLWALCHIAHVRPTFRPQDWAHYVAVNEKFAEAVIEEAKTDEPVVLVQDYHFALLPKLIRQKLPKATVITFWHIPFPNPEVFGICPWRDEILEGLLGSSILGFHTRFHCHNFIDAVDRFIESRIDREESTISHKGLLTAVKPYPISIDFPANLSETQSSIEACRAAVRNRHDLPADHFVGIGIDRLDYTKGILERFNAVERFLELCPEWVGKFTFVQIAAPSRSSIEEYQKFDAEVRSVASRINHKFSKQGYEPICLIIEHHTTQEVVEYYRASDLCFVSSLHDGMNLVAKEFIASRDDERGVLILSQFTGAARELPEALIVNPYNIDQCAAAIKVALEMNEQEQSNRMRSMRGLIKEFNVYRWAGRMLLDAARLRERSRLFGSLSDSSDFSKFLK